MAWGSLTDSPSVALKAVYECEICRDRGWLIADNPLDNRKHYCICPMGKQWREGQSKPDCDCDDCRWLFK